MICPVGRAAWVSYPDDMTVPQLPPDFIAAITSQLGAEAAEFLATYEHPATYGLRVNPAKSSLEQLRDLTG